MRLALELSIDREELNHVVFDGEFQPGNQWVAPTNPYYVKELPIPARDVAKAKALLCCRGRTQSGRHDDGIQRVRGYAACAGHPGNGQGKRL